MDKRIVAPLIVTTILVLIQIGYAYLILRVIGGFIPLVWKIIIELVFIGLIGTMIYQLIQRIKEIRSGEEDDLSKY